MNYITDLYIKLIWNECANHTSHNLLTSFSLNPFSAFLRKLHVLHNLTALSLPDQSAAILEDLIVSSVLNFLSLLTKVGCNTNCPRLHAA